VTFIRSVRGHLGFAALMPILVWLYLGGTAAGQSMPGGEWSPTFVEWSNLVNAQDCKLNGCQGSTAFTDQEFAHAALIPKGPYAGNVLLWRLEYNKDPSCFCTPSGQTISTWMVDPGNPACLYRIDTPSRNPSRARC